MAASSDRRPKLGDILTRLNLVTDAQVQEALTHQAQAGGLFGESLLGLGHISEDDLSWALSSQLGYPFVAITPDMVDPELLSLFPEEFLRRSLVVPLVASEGSLSVVLADPTDEATVKRLQFISHLELDIAVGTQSGIRGVLDGLFAGADESTARLLRPDSQKSKTPSGLSSPDLAQLLDRAFSAGAVSVHLDPEQDHLRVRFRDGTGKLTEGGKFEKSSRDRLLQGLGTWLGKGEKPAPGIQVWDTGRADTDLPFRAISVDGETGVSLTLVLRDAWAGQQKVAASFEPEWTRLDQLLRERSGLVLAAAPTVSGREQLLGRFLGQLDTTTRRSWALGTGNMPKPLGMLTLNAPVSSETFMGLAEGDGVDVLAVTLSNLNTMPPLIEVAGHSTLVAATAPGNSALGLVARVLEAGISPTLLSQSLLAVMAQRILFPIDPTASPRAVTEMLFVDPPLRRALQNGGTISDLVQAATEQGFTEIATRARDGDGIDPDQIAALDRYRYTEEAA